MLCATQPLHLGNRARLPRQPPMTPAERSVAIRYGL